MFQYISIALHLAYNKNKLDKTLDYWSRDMLNFDFLELDLGKVSPYFAYDFSKKCFSYYSLLTDQISLFDCLYFLRSWAICVLQLFISQVMTSCILKLTVFLIKSLFYMTKKSRQNLNIVRAKRAFKMK